MSMVILILAAVLITGGVLIVREKKRSKQQDASEKDGEVRETESDEGLTLYTQYTLTRRQWITSFIIAGSAGGVIGYLFYHHVIVALLCVGLGAMYPRFRRRTLLHKRRSELSLQFKQALYSLSSSLAAGRSVENAFYEVVQDLQLLYPDANTDLIREFRIIRFRLENGEPIEMAVQDFSRRAGIEDITNFADVFTACKRTGGDLVEVVRRTSTMIGEKIDIQQEISVMVAQKKFESKVIMLAPVGFLAFLNMSAPDFMTPMYSGVGIIVSTFALFGLIACSVWILKIMDIRV